MAPSCLKHITLFTNPYAQAGYDTRSIFKLSLTGLTGAVEYTDCISAEG